MKKYSATGNIKRNEHILLKNFSKEYDITVNNIVIRALKEYLDKYIELNGLFER